MPELNLPPVATSASGVVKHAEIHWTRDIDDPLDVHLRELLAQIDALKGPVKQLHADATTVSRDAALLACTMAVMTFNERLKVFVEEAFRKDIQ